MDQGGGEGGNLHRCQCRVDGCTSYFHCYKGIETTDGGFKGGQKGIIVGKDTILSGLQSDANTSRNIFLGWFEPSITLSLKRLGWWLNDRNRQWGKGGILNEK